MANFSEIYPDIDTLRVDMVEVICNITETKAEAKVLINEMDRMIANPDNDIIDVYNKTTEMIEEYNK